MEAFSLCAGFAHEPPDAHPSGHSTVSGSPLGKRARIARCGVRPPSSEKSSEISQSRDVTCAGSGVPAAARSTLHTLRGAGAGAQRPLVVLASAFSGKRPSVRTKQRPAQPLAGRKAAS